MSKLIKNHIRRRLSTNPIEQAYALKQKSLCRIQEQLNALKQMSPSGTKDDVELVWREIIEMVNDPDDDVRYEVLHIICSGSIKHMEEYVLYVLEIFNHDINSKIRRSSQLAIRSYLLTGKYNIL
jgi:ATP-dependent helicase/DNAse subunit B